MAKRQSEYKEIYKDKGKSIGQKEVEQMMRRREMSKEERKLSKKIKQNESEGSGREVPQNINKCPNGCAVYTRSNV